MKSLLMTNNNTATAVVADGVVPLGSAIHGFGQAVRLNGNAINLIGNGYYAILANITAAVTAATAITATIYADGVATVASASATPTEAGATVNLTIPYVIRKGCCANASAVTVVLSEAATVSNATVIVVKV